MSDIEESKLPTSKKLLKFLVLSHFINICLGLLVFVTLHMALNLGVITSALSTVAATTIFALLISAIGNHRIGRSIHKLGHEITNMHQKINSSAGHAAREGQYIRASLDSLPVGLVSINSGKKIALANTFAIKILGLDHLVANAKNPTITYPQLKEVLSKFSVDESDRRSASIDKFIDQIIDQGQDQSMAWQNIKLKLDQERLLVCDLKVAYSNLDNQGRMSMIIEDKTDSYLEQEQQMSFIALAAHELRAPVTVIRGLVDLLEKEVGSNCSDEVKQLLSRMEISSKQLASYIGNILGASKVNQDSFKVSLTKCNWYESIENTLKDLDIRARVSDRSLQVDIPSDLPDIAIDPVSIHHVINNLVDNAIKYSQPGNKVLVRSELKNDMIETTVQDFGVGIPENVLDNLFTKFYRSHRSKQIVSGTGLGLYLAKAIVEAHGGSIWVKSKEGMGATFGFSIPTYAAAKNAAKKPVNSSDPSIVRSPHGWIKNHSMVRK